MKFLFKVKGTFNDLRKLSSEIKNVNFKTATVMFLAKNIFWRMNILTEQYLFYCLRIATNFI